MDPKEASAPRLKKPVLRLKKGAFLELGSSFPYPITNEKLQGKDSHKHIRAIQNWERDNNVQVLGKLIVTD